MGFEELKQRQSVMWGNGRFEVIADTVAHVHDALVKALAPEDGERWLDLACGTGAVAERAARAGADVAGVDLAPALIETARHRSSDLGLDIDYRVGDCENLSDIEDGEYDVVSSSFGIMFCPDQRAAAGELARVVRSGGRVGLSTWSPEGDAGGMFRMLSAFQPPPPPDAGAPLDWGRPEYLEELLGEAVELRFEERISTLVTEGLEEHWQLYVNNFGPIKTLAESLEEERREELHQAWLDFYGSRYGSGPSDHHREYLLVLGTRR
jgi:ubiquinone/menaquinone biosynthesis C-methylase UbiE